MRCKGMATQLRLVRSRYRTYNISLTYALGINGRTNSILCHNTPSTCKTPRAILIQSTSMLSFLSGRMLIPFYSSMAGPDPESNFCPCWRSSSKNTHPIPCHTTSSFPTWSALASPLGHHSTKVSILWTMLGF